MIGFGRDTELYYIFGLARKSDGFMAVLGDGLLKLMGSDNEELGIPGSIIQTELAFTVAVGK